MPDTRIVALCGKGGVGKTSVSALMVKELARRECGKILAIDADPAVGLATSLGVTVRKTVDDIRKGLVGTLREGGAPGGRETLELLDYEVFVEEMYGTGRERAISGVFSFVAIGADNRPIPVLADNLGEG